MTSSARSEDLTTYGVAALPEYGLGTFDLFKQLRWPETGGQPVCPVCGTTAVTLIQRKAKNGRPTPLPTFRCKLGDERGFHNFTITSGTVFGHLRIPLKKLLFAVSLFVTAPIAMSAPQLAKHANINVNTATILMHKLRELMAQEQIDRVLEGEVEVDGVKLVRKFRQPNKKSDHVDARKISMPYVVIVTLRQRSGPSMVGLFDEEAGSLDWVRRHTKYKQTTLLGDKATSWNLLRNHCRVKQVNHSLEMVAYEDKLKIHTNNCESLHGRIRVAAHAYGHFFGPHLYYYAVEQAWRRDHRLDSASEKLRLLMHVGLNSPSSKQWTGTYQRRTGRNSTRTADPNKVRDPIRKIKILKAMAKAEKAVAGGPQLNAAS